MYKEKKSVTTGHLETPKDERSVFKYLGFTQFRNIDQEKIKQELAKIFSHRIELIMKSNLNSKNTVKAINTFALAVVMHSFGYLHWSTRDVNKLQSTINDSLIKHKKHHCRSNIQRITLPRHEGGRGILDIVNLKEKKILTLRTFFRKNAKNSELLKHIVENDKNLSPLNLHNQKTRQNKFNEILIEHKITEWSDETNHGKHLAALSQDDIAKCSSNEWLVRGELVPETEGFMIAIQDQVVSTRHYKKNILQDSHQRSVACRHCQYPSETIQHITGGCQLLAQTGYKHRHDQVAGIIHQELAFRYKLISEMTPYYKYKAAAILENSFMKIFWDQIIITNKPVRFNTPDIIVHDKVKKSVFIIEIAIPNTSSIQLRTSEKLTKYEDLANEIKTEWKAKNVKIVPIVLSNTGIVPKSLLLSLKLLEMRTDTLHLLQKVTILNTCRITRKFLTSSTLS